jgi:hypothetical protein
VLPREERQDLRRLAELGLAQADTAVVNQGHAIGAKPAAL